MTIKYISVHHSGGKQADPYAPSGNLSVADIDAAHRARWPEFRSKKGWWVGYTVVIRKDGTWTQTRYVGEEGAHTIGHNSDSVGICLIGNFTKGRNGQPVEMPTQAQITTLRELCLGLVNGTGHLSVLSNTEMSLSMSNIWPHRHFWQTACYGDALDDFWAQRVVSGNSMEDPRVPILKKILALLMQQYELLKAKKNLGGNDRGCAVDSNVDFCC